MGVSASCFQDIPLIQSDKFGYHIHAADSLATNFQINRDVIATNQLHRSLCWVSLANGLLTLPEGCEARCPGCAHRRLHSQASGAQKEAWLQKQLAPWRENFSPLQTVAEQDRWGYRNRVCLSTRWCEEKWQFGLLSRKELIAIPRCPVHSERTRHMVGLLSQALPPGPVFPMAFYVQSAVQATLILKTHRRPDLLWLTQNLQRKLIDLGMEGLWLHLHPAVGKRLFTKKGWRLIWGNFRSYDSHGLSYGPSAFQQLIPALYRNALDTAETFLSPTQYDSVVDLYCGIGASLKRWSSRGARVLGVELAGEAVECARHNVPQALLLRGKCSERIPQLNEWIKHKTNPNHQSLLYVNPPRTGIEPQVLEWVIGVFRPQRMAYLSCSAGTLRRDLDRLVSGGYQVVRIKPYDFFPQTHHVETLVLLTLTAI